MTSSIFYIFAAALVVASADELLSDEASFSEATAFVQSYSTTEGGGDSACQKVADDAVKVITDECKDLQRELQVIADSNLDCCTSGKTDLCHAKSAHRGSKSTGDTCRSEVATLEKVKIDLPSVQIQDLKKGCFNYDSVPAYRTAKNKLTKKQTQCATTKGVTAGLLTAMKNSIQDAATSREKCSEKVKGALVARFIGARSKCQSKTNKAAYTRAMHMKCVLAGTKLKDCKLGGMPDVTKPAPMSLKCRALDANTACQHKGVKIIGGSTRGDAPSSCQYGGHKGLKVNWRCSGGKVALYSMKSSTMGGTGNANEWRKNIFSCPNGWRWAKHAEFMAVTKAHGCEKSNAKAMADRSMSAQNSGYAYYQTCGWSQYNAGPVGGDADQQKFIFSDSHKNNKCQHAGQGLGSTTDCTYSKAGIGCIKI